MIDISQTLQDVGQSFGLSKSELADVFGVTRIELYGWLENKTKPCVLTTLKLLSLYGMGSYVPPRVYMHMPSYKKKALTGLTEQSLFDLLLADDLSGKAIEAGLELIIKTIDKGIAKNNRLRAKAGPQKPRTRAEIQENLDRWSGGVV